MVSGFVILEHFRILFDLMHSAVHFVDEQLS